MKQMLILICTIALGFPLALTGCDDSAEQKAELESVKAELQQLKTAIGKTESERDTLKVKIALDERNREQLREQVNKLTGSRDKLQEQVEEFTFTCEQSQQQFVEIIGTRDKLKQQVTELTGSSDKLQQQLIELNTSRNQLRRQVDELIRSRDAAVSRAQIAQERVDILLALVDAETKGYRELQDQDELIVTSQADEDTQPPIIEVSENPEVLTDINWPPVIPSQVSDRPTCHSFNTARPQIMPGQTSTLSWQVSNAERIRIEPGIGPVSALGSRAVNPSTTTTYTLIAANEAGQSRLSCRVEISERITIFSTDAIHPRILLGKYTASEDHKVLPEQKSQVSDPNTTLGKFIGYRARQDESGKFVFIPVYENKLEK